MDINKIIRADYLDIVFDGRNKSYGGYELRKKYGRRSLRAMGLVTVAAAIGFAVPVVASSLAPKAPKLAEKVVVLENILPPVPPDRTVVPPPPPPPRTAQPDPPPTEAFTPPRVVEDRDVEKPMASKDDLKDKAPGPTTGDGAGSPFAEIGPEGPGGGGRLQETSDGGSGEREAPVRFVEQMPEFRGDLIAWLSANLRYPDAAREMGVAGRSVIEFVVNEDGSIEAARVARSAHPLLDAEALRVVGAMPKWKPGKQNGRKVRVFFTLPIGFELD